MPSQWHTSITTIRRIRFLKSSSSSKCLGSTLRYHARSRIPSLVTLRISPPVCKRRSSTMALAQSVLIRSLCYTSGTSNAPLLCARAERERRRVRLNKVAGACWRRADREYAFIEAEYATCLIHAPGIDDRCMDSSSPLRMPALTNLKVRDRCFLPI